LSWWYLSFYFPRLFISRFVKRTPDVQSFCKGGTSSVADQLREVNVSTPTKMCRVMTSYGSDKGTRSHNYTTIYSVLFEGRQEQPLRIFELGLGTNNPNLPGSMGVDGIPGASLRGWRELFPHAHVYGADVDRSILFQEDRIKTFYCDQCDAVSIRELWSHADLGGGMDIIVEDGMHTFEANISFLEGSLEHLLPGGIYIIEDIPQNMIERWRERLQETYSKQYPQHEFTLVRVPNPFNPFDNNLLIACALSSPLTKCLRA
jgi:hypothetical protein